VENVGSLDAEQETIGNVVGAVNNNSQNTTLSNGSETTLEWDNTEKEDSQVVTVDLANNEISVDLAGDYEVGLYYRLGSDPGWSTGDGLNVLITVNGSTKLGWFSDRKIGTSSQVMGTYVEYLEDLSANDTIAATVEQNTGADKAINAGRSNNKLWIKRIG